MGTGAPSPVQPVRSTGSPYKITLSTWATHSFAEPVSFWPCSPAVPVAQTAPIRPIIKLEKPKYVVGESVLFWVGLETAVPNTAIPTEIVNARKPCSLNITKPDGSHETQPIGWPYDGDPSRGWLGGDSLPSTQAGDYTLVLECSGVSTDPVTLPVIKNPIAKQIKITLKFEKSGNLHRSASVPFVFDVRNDSPYYIQFPERGTHIGGTTIDYITLHVVRHDPPITNDLFFPTERPRRHGDTAVSDPPPASPKVATITLVPGGHLEQQYYLEDGYKLDEPGDYEITVATSVTILAREQDGKLKDFSPIRLTAKQTAKFTISNSVY